MTKKLIILTCLTACSLALADDAAVHRGHGGVDLFNREGYEFVGVNIDETFPDYILKNKHKFTEHSMILFFFSLLHVTNNLIG